MKRRDGRGVRTVAMAAAVIAMSSPVAAAGYQPSGPSPSSSLLAVEAGVIRHDGSGVVRSSAAPFLVLQLNLCNSGFATGNPTNPGCYTDGKSVLEAFEVIVDTVPSLVTLNEVCREDIRTSLSPAMARLWPNEWVFWGFMPAGDHRRPDGRYRCKNGDVFGIGMLGRLFTTGTPYLKPYGNIYPPDRQDPSSPELRSWLCVDANRSYRGCTTHLREGGGRIALDQCNFLTRQVIPDANATAGYHPTVVAGDQNLTFQPGDRFDVQQCVPGGWFRKGDGDVQHTMSTNDFTFNDARRVPMEFTDHPAWAVSLTKP